MRAGALLSLLPASGWDKGSQHGPLGKPPFKDTGPPTQAQLPHPTGPGHKTTLCKTLLKVDMEYLRVKSNT